MQVKSTVKLNMPRIRQLSQAAVKALEMTAEALHTEVVQAQVVPRDTGAMQGERTFIQAGDSVTATYENGDTATNSITKAHNGKVSIITAAPQVRRLYYHPEYNFQKDENPNARGNWYADWMPGGSKADFAPNAFKKFYKKVGDV